MWVLTLVSRDSRWWVIIKNLMRLKLTIPSFSFNLILFFLTAFKKSHSLAEDVLPCSGLFCLTGCCTLWLQIGRQALMRPLVVFAECPGEFEQYWALHVVQFSCMLPTVSRAAAQSENIHMVLRESHNQSICWQAGLSHVQLMNNLQRLWEGKLRSALWLAWPFPLHLSLCLHFNSTDSWQVWIWERC